MQIPKFGALLMYANGGGINFQPHGLVLTDNTSKYALDDVVLASSNEYYDDVTIGKSDEVKELASAIEDTTPKQATTVRDKLIAVMENLLEARHFDASSDFSEKYRGADYKLQTYHQDNPDNFSKLKTAILDNLKDKTPGIVTKPDGTNRLIVDPFGETDLIF